MKRAIRSSILFVALISFSGHASANEFTDVIDSFDYAINDPFDINISVGYLMSHKHGVISRETTLEKAHEWDFYAYRNMFEFKHVQHILDMNLEVGIFRDISLRIGLPLILSDSRSLTAHSDWVDDGRPWSATSNQSSTPLFGAFGRGDTFKSSRRSGVDYFSVGLSANPLDQSREITFPTWTIFVEGRFGVGKSLRASCADGQAGCDDDFVDRGGVGRGVHEIHFGTRLSRRISRLFDPYFGVDAIVGFPKGDHRDTDFFASEEKAGQINTLPPIRGTMDVGFEIIPWEQKSKHRRLVIGLGGGATYNSEGREYTPLYDALGTSDYFLDSSYFVDFNGNGQSDGGDERKAAQRWTGMTDIENYVTIFGNAFVLVQPAKYIKFRIGGRWAHETEHFITKTDMCSIGLIESVTGSNKEECENYNYGYRSELDSPGARFKAVKTFVGDFYLNVTAMF